MDLLGAGRPLAIGRHVTERVVGTIDGQAGRRMTHVGEKAEKRMLTVLAEAPPFADGDGNIVASAVIGVAAMSRVKATRQHASPNTIGTSLREAVLGELLFPPLSSIAPTTF